MNLTFRFKFFLSFSLRQEVYFDIGVRDASHVHSRKLRGLNHFDVEGLGVEIVLDLILQFSQVLLLGGVWVV